MKNRVIKFRGQRIDNNEFVIGYYVIDPDLKSRIYLKPFEGASNNTYYFVKEETVGQFTGLLDKNGEEIFEGDVCKHNNDIAEIVFYEGAFIFSKHYTHEYALTRFACCKSFEVIGNIFENPNLI